MVTILEQFADALQAPLQGFFCDTLQGSLDRLLTLAISSPAGAVPNPAIGYLLTPPSCPASPRFPSPITGGQCPAPALYRVCFQITNPATGFVRDACIDEVGPVTYITEYWESDFFGNASIGAEIGFPSAPASFPNPAGIRRFIPTQAGAVDPGRVGRVALTGVFRLDGPDNCGSNPNPVLPPAQPQGPFSISFPLQIGPNNVTFSGSVTFSPAIFAPILGGVLIPVQVNLNPNVTFSVPISFPVYLDFPSLTIRRGISFNAALNIETIINVGGGGGGGGDCCECDDIREIVRDELDDKFPPGRPNQLLNQVFPAANSRVIALPPFTERVDINLTEIPDNARTQAGGEAPDVLYAGWYSFGLGTASGDRWPIHYENQSIPAVSNASNFSYTCYTGFQASVTIFYREETPNAP